MPERIAFDARYVNDRYHGIGRYAFRLLEALVEEASQRSFIVLRGKAPDTRFDWSTLRFRPNVSIVEGPWPLYWPQEQWQWWQLLRRLQVDLVHSPYFVAPLLVRTPTVITVHDLIFDRYPHYMPMRYARPYYRLLMRLSTRRAQTVIAVSQATAHDLGHFYGTPPEKIAVIGEATDPAVRAVEDKDELQQLRKHYDLQRPYLLSVGARRPHKNLARLVQAFARAASGFPHELILVGTPDERFEDEAGLAVRRLGLNGRVRFLGWVPEEHLPGLYTMASALAMPSLVEGFGLPLLEAMACGTPVLAHNGSALPEVAGEAGLLVDATSIETLAQGLRQLLNDEDLRRRLSIAGRERVERFTWRRAAQQVLRVYKTGDWRLEIDGNLQSTISNL